MNDKLDGEVNKEYYKEKLKDFMVGVLTLAMLGVAARIPKINTSNNKNFSETLKETTYTCVENSQRNHEIEERLRFDEKVKENNYNNLNKIIEERQQLEEIINKNLLANKYILPKELTTNNLYKEKMKETVRSELEKYNPQLASKSAYFVNKCLEHKINPLLVLYMWKVESLYGTKGIAVITKSIGNERSYSKDPNKNFKGFAMYDSFEEALKATLETLERLKKPTRGRIENLIKYWAPPQENETQLYVNTVKKAIVRNQEQIKKELENNK